MPEMRVFFVKRPLFAWLSFFILCLFLFIPTQITLADAIIIVDSYDDVVAEDGACTLREAILSANTNSTLGDCAAGSSSGTDTILLPAGVYALTIGPSASIADSGDLDITEDVLIEGESAQTTIISADGLGDRVFHVQSGMTTLKHLTIEGGEASTDGGGVYTESEVYLENVTVRDNDSGGTGGGVAVGWGADAVLMHVTVSNNSANYAGGGIAVYGSMDAENSTISNNDSGGFGNGLTAYGDVDLAFVTIADNDGDYAYGTAVDEEVGWLTIYHTILDDACTGYVDSLGYNAINGVEDCSVSGDTTGNLINTYASLGPLDDNGGETETHSLPEGSYLIDAGEEDDCPATDQRGVERPQGDYCDIGAFEYEPETDIFIVNTEDDSDDGECDEAHCSLREAILELQDYFGESEYYEGDIGGEIWFDIPVTGTPVINVSLPLPYINSNVVIDGTTQESGSVRIDGSSAEEEGNGLSISGFDTTIRGMEIVNFDGHGIFVEYSDAVLIEQNELAFNSGDGVRTRYSYGVTVSQNNIHDNGGLPIDMLGDGRTPNEPVEVGSEDFDFPQNYPVVFSAVPGETLAVQGLLFSNPESSFTIELFASETCSQSKTGPQTFIGSFDVMSNENGNVYFLEEGLPSVPEGTFLVATATGEYGDTSEFSNCVNVSIDNTSWPNALTLPVSGDLSPTEIEQYLDQYGQSRWYKFSVDPNSNVIVTLTNLPKNYDLTIYQDINAVYQSLLNPTIEDITLLNAEFAPEAFSPEAFSPEAFSPEAFSPEAFSPEAFSPEAFSPEAFSPEAFSPEAFSPEAFSPEAFSPEAFSPEAFSPEAFSPEAFSPEAFSPEAFSPEAFSSAQVRSLLGVSAFPGTAGEGISINTWNRTGEFYIRVRGSGGAFDTQQTFTLSVAMQSEICNNVAPVGIGHSLTAVSNNYKTLILTDFGRMGDSDSALQILQNRLATFANRFEVQGAILDLGSDAQVSALHAQADANPACPYAKNLVAESIKDLVDAYRVVNPELKYVVIVGNDYVVPFFRYPDNASLANENNYVPPVIDSSASQASLRLGFVLGQDEYGSSKALLFKNSSLPIPDLAVGRLVETAVEATTVLDAYLATNDGVVTVDTEPLVTGYDFLEDAALAVQTELEAGTGFSADTLITPSTVAPTDPASWTAQQLANIWLTERHDITFLAGHFSQSGALAADYTTRLSTADLLASPVDMQNALIFSAGCHSGYNLVDADGVPFVTETPDWAQAFAQKGATLIGGTGYQYGDTEFIEYSERLYLLFSQQLRTGSNPVAIGDALNAAKVDYLAGTQTMRGIHQKAVIQSTVFGLPMLKFDLGGTRLDDTNETSSIAPLAYTTNPGQTFGLSYYDLSVVPESQQETLILENVTNGSEVTTTYLTGPDGVVANPAEPVLPLKFVNVSLTDHVLRGVGFRGGTYTLLENIIPLTGAPTTEIRGVHGPFQIGFFYPVQMWKTNYFGALSGDNLTQLGISGAQFRSNNDGAVDGTLRNYSSLDLRLFYNNSAVLNGGGVPALAAPPTIVQTDAAVVGDSVAFRAVVLGNPAAGIQSVWVTITGDVAPFAGSWQSLDLTQNENDSTVWEGVLPLNGADPTSLRYLVQAVNGTGLVSLASNLGQGYGVVPDETGQPNPAATAIQVTGPASGAYSDPVSFSATLTSNGAPLGGERVRISVGAQTKTAVTDQNGQVSVSIVLLGSPGSVTAQASFAGTADYQASNASQPFTITKKDSVVTLTQPASGLATDPQLLEVVLTNSNGTRLREKSVVVVIEGSAVSTSRAAITDFAGRATIGNLPELTPGVYNVTVYFGGTIPLHTGQTLTINDFLYNPSTTTGTLTIEGDGEPPGILPLIYLSTNWNRSVAGVSFRREDILVYDPNDESWAIHFDGSDVGLFRNDIDAFAIMDNGDILISLKNPQNRLGSVGQVDDSDILRFVPTSVGDETAGTFEMFLDGSDVGLTHGNEDINAIGVTNDGRLIISTAGRFQVTGVTGTAQDLLVLDEATFGVDSSGTWSLYFDGSSAELANWKEVLYGVSVDSETGQLYFNTRREFSVSGAEGTGNDIFVCSPANSNPITACTYSTFWNAASADFEFHKAIVDAIHIGNPSVPMVSGPSGRNPNPETLYFTFTQRKDVGGIRFYNEDIARFDVETGGWSLYFDGSDVGMVKDDIDAFAIMANGDILFSVEHGRSDFPDVGFVDDSDIVRFAPTTIGSETSGTFSLYFDGSDVGLSATSEDIDALTLTTAGDLLISTTSHFLLPGDVEGIDRDLLLFTPTSLGETTAGTWSIYLDGTAVGLTTWRENIQGVHLNQENSALTLNTRTEFEVSDAAGTGNDLFQCSPANSSPITNCFHRLVWEALAHGLEGRPVVNGVHQD